MTETPREPPGDARRLLVELVHLAFCAGWSAASDDDAIAIGRDMSAQIFTHERLTHGKFAALSLEAPKLPCTCGPPSFPYQEHDGDCPRGLAEAVPSEAEEAHAYLSRLLVSAAPTCEPLPDLLGLCSQIDNLLTGLRAEAVPPSHCPACGEPHDGADCPYQHLGTPPEVVPSEVLSKSVQKRLEAQAVPSAPAGLRCEGRYPVPQTSPPRSEPFEVTYRCGRRAGHVGAHGSEDTP